MNTRREFLRLAGVGTAALASGIMGLGKVDKAIAKSPTAATAAPTDKPMNIVVLFADDWRYDTLGVAGKASAGT